MTRMIALLRAVNVGRRRLPMAELRAIAADIGLRDAETHVASGNLVFAADTHEPALIAARIEAAIEAHCGWRSEAIVRTVAQWAVYAGGSPFPDAERERPKLLHLLLSARPPAPDAAARLAERAAPGERIAMAGDALWIDFGQSVGGSKVTPAFIDKCAGSPTTGRNWNTVLRLHEMAQA